MNRTKGFRINSDQMGSASPWHFKAYSMRRRPRKGKSNLARGGRVEGNLHRGGRVKDDLIENGFGGGWVKAYLGSDRIDGSDWIEVNLIESGWFKDNLAGYGSVKGYLVGGTHVRVGVGYSPMDDGEMLELWWT
jgi:hypothetical protein